MSNPKGEVLQKKIVRAQDFRYLPCDAINLGISDNGVKLILGVEEMDGTTLECVGIHLTHKTAAFLQGALSQAVKHYEETTGHHIDVPEFRPDERT